MKELRKRKRKKVEGRRKGVEYFLELYYERNEEERKLIFTRYLLIARYYIVWFEYMWILAELNSSKFISVSLKYFLEAPKYYMEVVIKILIALISDDAANEFN